MANRPTIALIGAGRAGKVIGIALANAGYQVMAVASRTRSSADAVAKGIREAGVVDCLSTAIQAAATCADLVLITVPDGVIAEVAGNVRWKQGQRVVHCSGALGIDALDQACDQGAETGSWHPFQTLTGTAKLEGVTFGIEASADLYEVLAEMSRALGGIPLEVLAEARPLYHAASVLACGYLTTLLRDARRVWEAAGLPEDAGRRAIGAIAEATLTNALRFGEESTLTGPVSRGDMGTIKLHLDALSESTPELLSLYAAISRRSAVLSLEAGRPTRDLTEWDRLYAQFVPPGLQGTRQAKGED